MKGWRDEPATRKQLAYIQDMHEFSDFPIPAFTGNTKGEASDYINRWSKRAHEAFDFRSDGDNYGDR